jgi:hypothetical protein
VWEQQVQRQPVKLVGAVDAVGEGGGARGGDERQRREEVGAQQLAGAR